MTGSLSGSGEAITGRSLAQYQPLAGRVAAITGGNTGIGRAIALSFAAAGADLAVNYIDHDQAAFDLAAEIKAKGRRCILQKGDTSQECDVSRLFQAAVETFGTVHIAVANAGIQRDAPIERMSLDQWNAVIAVNLTGAFLCAREAAREFLRRGVGEGRTAGNILFVTSVHQSSPWPGRANYSAAKAGAAMLMRTIGQELAPHRIRVNAIAPGAIRTDLNRESWENPVARHRLEALIPHGRIGLPEEVGEVALWLASDCSDYVNGTTVYVDGGLEGKMADINMEDPIAEE